MPNVKGCNLPDELLYDVENHIWFKELGDGTVKVGMTTGDGHGGSWLRSREGRRREVKAGKSCATVESGKWVGPAKVAAAGEVVAVNEALVANPSMANSDPYGEGWLIVLRPEAWDSVKPSLVPGAQVAGPYEAKMAADGFAGCA
jgi:glycine cleavage system H protein